MIVFFFVFGFGMSQLFGRFCLPNLKLVTTMKMFFNATRVFQAKVFVKFHLAICYYHLVNNYHLGLVFATILNSCFH